METDHRPDQTKMENHTLKLRSSQKYATLKPNS